MKLQTNFEEYILIKKYRDIHEHSNIKNKYTVNSLLKKDL